MAENGAKSINGCLLRRTPMGFFSSKGPGDWVRVWCEFEYATGVLNVYLDEHKYRRVLNWRILQCSIQHVRNDGRYCIEIEYVQLKKKETFSSAPESKNKDIEWWFEVLTSSKLTLAEGRVPTPLSLVRAPLPKIKIKERKVRMPSKPALRRRQPKLTTSVSRFERIVVYETLTHFYVVGSDRMYTRFRMFTLDRMNEAPESLAAIFTEDPTIYTCEEIEALLQNLDKEARAKTKYGLVRAVVAVAIVGFIKFLQGYYMILVTKRQKVGCIGGHYIYSIQATQCIPISQSKSDGSWTWVSRWLNPSPLEDAEARYLTLFHFVDLTKDFYFSYTYDLTHTLQHNMTTDQTKSSDMFEWNFYLNREFSAALSAPATSEWVQPLILGFYEQRKCSLFGRLISIIVLARRSRHFAGTRYLKRGIADTGYVANDVETEQIIEDENTHSKFSAYVQHRGSIPIFWAQETKVTNPKPPIQLNRIDPSYKATQAHFSNLFERYGSPIVAFNLVKQHEKVPREIIVGTGFKNAVDYLNTFIPPEHQIRYIAMDHSRFTKSEKNSQLKTGATRAVLDKICSWALNQTGIFCSAPKRQIGGAAKKRTGRGSSPVRFNPTPLPANTKSIPPAKLDDTNAERPQSPTIPRNSGDWLEQHGVLRTNCIDCLDRTNVAQYSAAVQALCQQLYAMGIRNKPHMMDDASPILLEFSRIFSSMGDKIALQYGGSEAHKKVESQAQKTKQWELLTSIRRYYSNAFTDMAKQDSINLFLGNFIPDLKQPPLWELESDYYLHNCCVERPLKLTEMGPFHRINNLVALKRRHRNGQNTKAEYLRLRQDLLSNDWWKKSIEAFEAPKFLAEKLSLPSPARHDMLQRKSSAMSSTYSNVEESGIVSERSTLWMQTQDREELFSFDAALASSFMLPIELKNNDVPSNMDGIVSPSMPSSHGQSFSMGFVGSGSLTRQIRSMSAPEETITDVSMGLSIKRSLSNMRLQELVNSSSNDEKNQSAIAPADVTPLDIEEYAASRGIRRDYIGNYTPVPTDSIYERYVESGESLAFWEKEVKNSKSDFILYLRDLQIDPDDVASVAEAAVRGGCTYKIQSGVYAGLDRHVKARGLLSKKFFKNDKDRQFIQDALDTTQMSEMHHNPSDIEIYKSYFDEAITLPDIVIGDTTTASTTLDNTLDVGTHDVEKEYPFEDYIYCNPAAEEVWKSLANLHVVKN
ncbi:hypothetical protein THRCLA_01619 [Thraustotheca clavata]|uniref:SAC domain-containing protein n=1 Tax=Thraustotheca clavata TaxID=74557 RepID=A0A1W0A7S8_9STRA|nr:hypothetical protein THRCLA_01619 [Thraustotheca clavata]